MSRSTEPCVREMGCAFCGCQCGSGTGVCPAHASPNIAFNKWKLRKCDRSSGNTEHERSECRVQGHSWNPSPWQVEARGFWMCVLSGLQGDSNKAKQTNKQSQQKNKAGKVASPWSSCLCWVCLLSFTGLWQSTLSIRRQRHWGWRGEQDVALLSRGSLHPLDHCLPAWWMRKCRTEQQCCRIGQSEDDAVVYVTMLKSS